MKTSVHGLEDIRQKQIQKIQNINQEARQLYYHNPIKGLKLAARAYALTVSGEFENEPYQPGMAESLFSQSHFNLLMGEIRISAEQAEKSLQIYQTMELTKPQAEIYGHLGMIFEIQQNRTSAIEFLIKGLDIAKSQQDVFSEAKILLQISIVYYGMGNFRQSLHSISQAEMILRKHQFVPLLSFALIRRAQTHAQLNQMDKAFQAIYQALDFVTETEHLIVRSEALYSLGMMHLKCHELPIARTHLQYSQRISQKNKLRLLSLQANLGLSEILLQQNDIKQALVMCKKCLREAEDIGLEQMAVKAHFMMANIYENLSQFKISLYHFKIYNEITNRLFDQHSQQKIQTVEVLYRTKSATREAELTRLKNLELEKEIVDRKQAEQKLRKSEKRYRTLASFDPLTHLYNRRHFYQLAEIEFERATRYGHPLSLIMLDLDHFKRINDRYGHLVGDEMLAFAARLCKDNLRKIDLIGRFGGEEFIILLPETDAEGAFRLAERIGKTLEQSYLSSDKGPISITASIGISTRSELYNQLDMLVELADKALYTAKRTGRNKVIAASNMDYETGEHGRGRL